MKKRKIVIGIVIILLAVIVGFLLRYPSDPLTLCQKVLDGGFEQWKIANDTNGYPNVEGDGKRSFALAGQYMFHEGREYNEKYGYVPGLKDDDPADLVLMYLKKKTRRTWDGDLSGSILRDPKWMVIGPDFLNNGVNDNWLPEGGYLADTKEFKQRLHKTLGFLRDNKRPYWGNVVKEHIEFLRSIGEDELTATDMREMKEADERRERRAAARDCYVGEKPKYWRYRLTEKDGNARLAMDKLVLMFEGVTFSGAQSGGLQLSGGGSSSSSGASNGGPTFGTSYKDGAATLTFAGHTVIFLNEGRVVAVGTNEFQIGDDRPTLSIAKDGAVTMTSGAPNQAPEDTAHKLADPQH